MATFFTQVITIGFGSIKYCVYKARVLTAVDTEMRAINQIVFFCCFFGTSTFFGKFLFAMGLFDMLCSFVVASSVLPADAIVDISV